MHRAAILFAASTLTAPALAAPPASPSPTGANEATNAAAPTTPREAVTAVAKAIETTYFDAPAGRRIAATLRKEAAAGTYDRQSPGQLATTLSTRLTAYDRHFHVFWQPPEASGPQHGPPPSAYGPEERDRRAGYGFRQVQMLSGNVGYIALDSFAPIDFAQPDWPVRQAADAALKLVGRSDALIIDLRDNGGGDPSMVGYLASAFVPAERDIYNVFKGRTEQSSERPAVPYPGPRLTMPLYILTSGRTGSAAESFAYTLQAAGRATVIGENSAGAANPGGVVDLGGGYALFVSSMTPINPLTHGNWETTGVKPDRAVAAAKALDEAHILALETALPNVPPAERPDTQRAWEAARASRDPRVPQQATAYAGHYGPTTIAVQDHALVAQREHRPPITLGWIEADTFFPLTQPSTRYTFQRNADGSVGKLIVSFVDGTQSELDRSASQ